MIKQDGELVTKSVTLDKEYAALIEQLAKEEQRNFSSQLRYIVQLYFKKDGRLQSVNQ